VVASSSARLDELRQQIAQALQSLAAQQITDGIDTAGGVHVAEPSPEYFASCVKMDTNAAELVRGVELKLQELRKVYLEVETAGHDTGNTAAFVVRTKESLKPALEAMRVMDAKAAGVEALLQDEGGGGSLRLPDDAATSPVAPPTTTGDDWMQQAERARQAAEAKEAAAQVEEAEQRSKAEAAVLELTSTTNSLPPVPGALPPEARNRSGATVQRAQAKNPYAALMMGSSSSDEEDSDDEGLGQVVEKAKADRERKRAKAKENKGDE
jgi:hypothetical protein